MSNRAERREAERLARKLAYQEARNKPAQSQISEAQLAANRANAQLSTGPVTQAGRETSARNALKTGLTGRTVLLPSDDAAEYNRRLENAFTVHAPVTEEEQTLVQSLVDTDWRLQRIVTLESAIYLKGHIEFADAHPDQPAAHRKALIQAETYLKYEKALRNLNIQEARLQRQRAKDLAELDRLKAERPEQEPAPPKTAAAPAPCQPALHQEDGFEFSNPNPKPSSAASAAPPESFIGV